jgi:hypothetical protein
VQRPSDVNPIRTQLKFPNGVLVTAATPFDGGDCLAHFPASLEITQEQDIIGEIADVDRALQRQANGAGLSQNHDREHPAISEISKQFVQMHRKELLSRHRLEISVQAIEENDANIVALDVLPDVRDQFSRGHLRRIDAFDHDFAALQVRAKIDAQAGGSRHQGVRGFLEEE